MRTTQNAHSFNNAEMFAVINVILCSCTLTAENYLHDFLDYFDCIVCCRCIYLPFRDYFRREKRRSKIKVSVFLTCAQTVRVNLLKREVKSGILGSLFMVHTYRRNGFWFCRKTVRNSYVI